MGVAVDGFAPFDHGYRTAVLDFVGRLHTAGKFQLRTVRMPFSERRGDASAARVLYEDLRNAKE